MALVIAGSTSYLVGFITSSVGGEPDLRVREIYDDTKEQKTYISGGKRMRWCGEYLSPHDVNVGVGPLRSAFRGMYKYTSEVGREPTDKEVQQWCDILVIHFPEAARFDSLALCSINSRFADGGKVGEKAVTQAQSWSSDCRGALTYATETVTAESDNQNKKWNVKKGSKSETTKRKMPATKSESVKKSKKMTDDQIKETIEDVRLFHRPMPDHEVASLTSMPFQLDKGRILDFVPEEFSEEDAEMKKFLINPVDNLSHDACGYANGEWSCKCMAVTDSNTLAPKKKYTAGLYNLGNTCYVNSTLQCLHAIPELKSALLSLPDTVRVNSIDEASCNLTLATRDTFRQLDQSVRPVAPQTFLQMLREKHKQFAVIQRIATCNRMQKSAGHDWWIRFLKLLKQNQAFPMKTLFGIDLVTSVHCEESGEKHQKVDSIYSLKCRINQDVNNLHEGLELGLNSESQEFSSALSRFAVHTRNSRINKLARYLTVKFERSIWKEESGHKAKTLRKVDYPEVLDVYEFCSNELKQKLGASRQMLRDEKNEEFSFEAHGKASSSEENEGSASSTGEVSSMDIDKVEPSVPMEKLSGAYDLVAVLTHKGTTAASGNNVSWVKQDDGIWVQFNDDIRTIHNVKDVLELCGGGDAPMAYICLYKASVID